MHEPLTDDPHRSIAPRCQPSDHASTRSSRPSTAPPTGPTTSDSSLSAATSRPGCRRMPSQRGMPSPPTDAVDIASIQHGMAMMGPRRHRDRTNTTAAGAPPAPPNRGFPVVRSLSCRSLSTTCRRNVEWRSRSVRAGDSGRSTHCTNRIRTAFEPIAPPKAASRTMNCE